MITELMGNQLLQFFFSSLDLYHLLNPFKQLRIFKCPSEVFQNIKRQKAFPYPISLEKQEISCNFLTWKKTNLPGTGFWKKNHFIRAEFQIL